MMPPPPYGSPSPPTFSNGGGLVSAGLEVAAKLLPPGAAVLQVCVCV